MRENTHLRIALSSVFRHQCHNQQTVRKGRAVAWQGIRNARRPPRRIQSVWDWQESICVARGGIADNNAGAIGGGGFGSTVRLFHRGIVVAVVVTGRIFEVVVPPLRSALSPGNVVPRFVTVAGDGRRAARAGPR